VKAAFEVAWQLPLAATYTDPLAKSETVVAAGRGVAQLRSTAALGGHPSTPSVFSSYQHFQQIAESAFAQKLTRIE
jgi:hypothetical protein